MDVRFAALVGLWKLDAEPASLGGGLELWICTIPLIR
jgi:hypothetical protein